MKSGKIMAAGHICLDVTPVFPCRSACTVGDVLSPGRLVNVGSADIHTGGSVANTGLAMKLLGADVTLVGKVGKDQFGLIVRHILEQYGCPDGLVEHEGSDTSYSVVLAIPGVDRIFLHNPGANDTFSADDITADMLDGVSHFHFGYPPLMKRMYENCGEELVRLLSAVKQRGITTSLDMAMIDASSDAGQQDWHAILERIIPLVDIFAPSVEELCFMLDRARYSEWMTRAAGGDITAVLDIERDVKPLADELVAMGARAVVIKCGAPGIYYRTAGSEVMAQICQAHGLDIGAWSDIEGFEESYLQENIVSGTGAGDTSIAAFIATMTEGCDLTECVRLAAATGACCISAHDALSGLVPLDELRRRINAGWKKISEK